MQIPNVTILTESKNLSYIASTEEKKVQIIKHPITNSQLAHVWIWVNALINLRY